MSKAKTINPDAVSLQITNTVDFHKEFTDFTSVVDNFANELAISKTHEYIKYTSNPIANESNFFVDINNNFLNANYTGAVNSFAGNDPGSTGVSENLGLEQVNDHFVWHWIEEYRTAHEAVKSAVLDYLGEDNVYFTEFSENVGQLSHTEFTLDNSTIPLEDFDSTVNGPGPPKTYNSTVHHILPLPTKITTVLLSRHTNSVFRQNLKNLGEYQKPLDTEPKTITKSTLAHGLNLCKDSEHVSRMNNLTGDLQSIIETDLKDLKRVLTFIRTADVNLEVKKPNIKLNIEDYITEVDYLQNKLVKTDAANSASKITTHEMLGSKDNIGPKKSTLNPVEKKTEEDTTTLPPAAEPVIDETGNIKKKPNDKSKPVVIPEKPPSAIPEEFEEAYAIMNDPEIEDRNIIEAMELRNKRIKKELADLESSNLTEQEKSRKRDSLIDERTDNDNELKRLKAKYAEKPTPRDKKQVISQQDQKAALEDIEHNDNANNTEKERARETLEKINAKDKPVSERKRKELELLQKYQQKSKQELESNLINGVIAGSQAHAAYKALYGQREWETKISKPMILKYDMVVTSEGYIARANLKPGQEILYEPKESTLMFPKGS